jgi:hypothetical protein
MSHIQRASVKGESGCVFMRCNTPETYHGLWGGVGWDASRNPVYLRGFTTGPPPYWSVVRFRTENHDPDISLLLRCGCWGLMFKDALRSNILAKVCLVSP